jgi:hypothetical protein
VVSVEVLWVVGLMVVSSGILWTQRRKAAQREVDRRVERGGLLGERDLVEAALEWYRRRQEILILGVLAGVLIASRRVLTVSWLLGAAMPMSFEWPSDVPGYVEPLATVLFLVSVALWCTALMVAASRRGLQRVQRVAG